jgi:hypothetical protein
MYFKSAALPCKNNIDIYVFLYNIRP